MSSQPSAGPSRRSPSRGWRVARLGLWLTGIALACSSTNPVDDETRVPTALLVSPADFLGERPCADWPGAVQSYQATLIDISSDLDQPFALASSEVLSCKDTAFFAYVTPGRRYKALVEAFDRPELRAQSRGVRVAVDADGQPVAPRYVGYCRGEDGVSYGGAGGGDGDGEEAAGGGFALEGAVAQLNTRVYVRGCEPLRDSGSLGPTGVSIDVEPFLVGIECGATSGRIERFVVETTSDEPPPSGQGGAGGAGGAGGSDGSAAPSGPSAACGESVLLEDLPPASSVRYSVALYEGGASTPSYRTTCRAFTVAGAIVPATCTPVSASSGTN